MPPPSRPSASSSVPPVKVADLIGSSHILSTLPSKIPSSLTLPSHSGKETVTYMASDDVQIVATNKVKLLSLDNVLQHLHVVKHVVKGDGSCLYHAISHQAGFIPSTSQDDEKISSQLRNVASRMMWDHPGVHTETDMSFLQWLKKRQDILSHDSWGNELDVRLMAIGLQRDIIVITALHDGSTYAQIYHS